MSEFQERRDELTGEVRAGDAGAAVVSDSASAEAPHMKSIEESAHEAGPSEPAAAEAEQPARPEASSFWECGQGVRALDDPTPLGKENALGRLGKPPFEKSVRSRFRLLGYLATVYEHVSQDVGGTRDE